MFQKDWILENIANPTYDISDLVSLGSVNTDNTQFLSKEQIDSIRNRLLGEQNE